jgi:hypothetical protein
MHTADTRRRNASISIAPSFFLPRLAAGRRPFLPCGSTASHGGNARLAPHRALTGPRGVAVADPPAARRGVVPILLLRSAAPRERDSPRQVCRVVVSKWRAESPSRPPPRVVSNRTVGVWGIRVGRLAGWLRHRMKT